MTVYTLYDHGHGDKLFQNLAHFLACVLPGDLQLSAMHACLDTDTKHKRHGAPAQTQPTDSSSSIDRSSMF
jgi:hypothetical protein